ncbi:MAG TPA: hypothetical protein VK207_06985 [Bacteroidales bacterium]|nr:hypothetical protein [Bacteroidales bacterium]
MGRRAAIILSASLILVLTVVLYLTGVRKLPVSDPYSAVTPNACLIIETVDLVSFLNSITTGKGLTGELTGVKELSGFSDRLRYITDNLNKAGFRDLVSGGKAVISFYPIEKGKPGILLSMPVSSEIRKRHINQALASAGIGNIKDYRIGKADLSGIRYSENDTAFFSVRSGLLLVCNSGKLLRESFTARESGTDIRQNAGFSKVLLASGNDEDKFFVIFNNLPGILKSVFSPGSDRESSVIASLATAGGGALYLDDEGLVLSGFSESTDSTDLLYRYKFIGSSAFETYRILPASTALFESIIRSDSSKSQVTDTADRISVLAGGLRDYLGDEITRVYLNTGDTAQTGNNLMIYELNNPVQAEQYVSQLKDSETRSFQPDDQVNIPVYNIHAEGLGKFLYSGSGKYYPDSLVAFYDGYMITGSSYSTISQLLYDNLLNNTLANDMVYRDFESSLPSRSSYCFYCVPSKIIEYLSDYLSDSLIAILHENKSSLNKITAAGYQLASSNGMVYNSVSVRFRNEVKEESRSEWETLLDTTAAIKPFFFTNHLTGAKEIFVQDLKNNIYLINAAGRVLWKAPLIEKIEGAIYMIDYFGNGKYQLLFNGHRYLHLIDRNGNYVERFPVKLRSAATNPLALFDYDNNRNYRILIAGEDRMIYAYDKSGNVVKGWKPYRTSGLVKTQMSYFRSSGKDYLAASDETGLYLLDRYGNKRVSFKEPVTRGAGSVLKLSSGSESFLMCSSNDGSIQHIYFDGSVKKFTLKQFSPTHSMDIFDIDGDGFDEYVFLDQGKLYLYDHNRTELFSRDMGSVRLGGPLDFSFSQENKKIGVIDTEKNLIYLFDASGNIMDGFPLKGASMFSIGRLSERNSWNLIVGGPDRFLYNYLIGNGT